MPKSVTLDDLERPSRSLLSLFGSYQSNPIQYSFNEKVDRKQLNNKSVKLFSKYFNLFDHGS